MTARKPKPSASIFIGIFLIVSLGLAACSAEVLEPTPILPPPNVSVSDPEGAAGEPVEPPTAVPEQNGDASPPAAAETVESEVDPEQPTPTLEVTATAMPTPAATPVTDPPTQAVTTNPMPASSRDLLFLADGAFKRWSQEAAQIEVLFPGPPPAERVRDNEGKPFDFAGDISHYSVSADGKRVVVARLTMTEEVSRTNSSGSEYSSLDSQHELWFMDLVSQERWQLLPRVDNLDYLSLAPDARHVAFSGSGLDGTTAFNESDGRPLARIYFLATGGGNAGPVVEVATCDQYCSPIVWHPDNSLFSWGDEAALWLRNVTGTEPELLLQNKPFAPEGNGDIRNVEIYSPRTWAGNGRYLLLRRGLWEGSTQSVFDVTTRTVLDIPGTYTYVDPFPTEVMWMPDDRLYVLRSQVEDNPQPQVELWRFQPEQNQLVQEESRVVGTPGLGALGQQYLEDGRFAYVLVSNVPLNNEAGNYHLTSLSEAPARVNASPPTTFSPGANQAAWASDGSGAILVQNDNMTARVYYGPSQGEFLFDISVMLGSEPHHFHWQPEIALP